MKKGKKILKYLGLALVTLTMSVATSSCGFLSSGEAEVTSGIASMIITPNEDGTQTLTITYLDEDKEDDVFILPAGGETGSDGVSIVGISIEQIDPYTNLVTIYLANAETPYVTFYIPSGSSITNIEVIKDDPNSTTGWVIITLSDGSTRQMEVYYSSKGDDGWGIIGMSYTTDRETGLITSITFVYSDYTFTTIEFEYYQGETGYSITIIETYQQGDMYYIVIYYDGYDEEDGPLVISFDIPSDPYTWYNGENAPEEDLGVVGDQYFDIKNLVIYKKTDEGWTVVLSILDYYTPNANKVNITFNLNDSECRPAAMPSIYNNFIEGDNYIIKVSPNTYFTQTMPIPIPTRSGYSISGEAYSYDFMGWCTSKEPTPTSGYLTDLTSLVEDMTFYAIWEESE